MDDELRDLLRTAAVEVAAPVVGALMRRARRQHAVRVATLAVAIMAVVGVGLATVAPGDDDLRPEIVATPDAGPSDVASSTPTNDPAPDVPEGYVAVSAGWTLRAISPDRTRLVIEFDLDTCDQPHLVEVAEEDDAVRVDVEVVRSAFGGVCRLGEFTGGAGPTTSAASGVPADLGSNQVAIDLDTQLDGRELLGCDRPDCAAVVPSTVLPSNVGRVIDGIAVRATGPEVVAIGADGTIRWQVTLPAAVDTESVLRPNAKSVLVRTQDGGLVSLAADDGAVQWRVDREEYGPATPVLVAGLALLRDRVVFDVVHAVDLATGEVAWRTELPGDPDIGIVASTSSGEILVGSVINGEVPTVSVLAVPDGAVERSWQVLGSACDVQDPPDPACRGGIIPGNLLTAFGTTVVIQLTEGIIQFRDVSGEQVAASLPRGEADVVDQADGVAIVRGQTIATLRDGSGQVVWTLPLGDIGVLAAATDDVVITMNGPFIIGRSRRGAGEELWRTSPGVTSASTGGSANLIVSIPGLDLGIDARTGGVTWWLPNDTANAAPVIRTE